MSWLTEWKDLGTLVIATCAVVVSIASIVFARRAAREAAARAERSARLETYQRVHEMLVAPRSPAWEG